MAQWYLKKAEEEELFGPVDEKTLYDWAKSAQIAPTDTLSTDQQTWMLPSEVTFLKMIWIVELPEPKGTVYGPTTTGALREYLKRGMIDHNSLVTNQATRQTLPLGALLASEDMEQKRVDSGARTGMIMMDLAKDQRIRQLTEDLRELKAEHEALKQKFRQLQQDRR